MKKFYLKAVLFWGVLLVLAIANAVAREAGYKPWLEPFVGKWAHQLSTVTAIGLFYVAIRWFVGKCKGEYEPKDLVGVGLLWVGMTLGFETWMNMAVRGLSLGEVAETYYIWKGETWPLVLAALVVIPVVAGRRSGSGSESEVGARGGSGAGDARAKE